MMDSLSFLWQKHRGLLVAFTLAAALTMTFAVRMTYSYVYWSNHRDEPIQGWMTVGYVARSYDVPREDLSEALGVTLGSVRGKSLEQIAQERDVTIDSLAATLQTAIERSRSEAVRQ
jgi:hypothetical protein